MSDLAKRLEQFARTGFDPESADYDYATAERAGMRRDRRGHMGSVAPVPGEPDIYRLLKGRKHPTWDKGVAAENMRGSAVVKREDGNYYSEPFAPGGGYADGGSVEDEDPVPSWTPEQIRSMTHSTPQQHSVPTIQDHLRSMRDIAAEHYVRQAQGLVTEPGATVSRNVRTASELALPVTSAYKLADVATGASEAIAPDAWDVGGDLGALAGYGAGRQALRALGSVARRAAPAAAASVPFVAFPQDAEAGGKNDILRLAREAVDARLPSGTFSPAARAIESAPQDMTGGQWRNFLRGRSVDVSGQRFPVRPDELQFTGLDALLAQHEGTKVGRGELLDFLRNDKRILIEPDDVRGAQYPREDVLGTAERRPTAGGAQYEQYQLPGPRENYEESLTRMPGLEYHAPHFGTIGRDLVSHSRMSTRPVIEPDGRQARGVHIDEIQSDLHQKARDEGGYREPGAGSRRDELMRQRQAFETEVVVFDDTNNRVFRAVQQLMREPPSPERDRQLRILREQRREAFNAREELLRQIREIDQALPGAERSSSNLPPRAPYQDRYHEVEFNKALRRAVDEDADYVTWTTGEQQAQRWNQRRGDFRNLRYDPADSWLKTGPNLADNLFFVRTNPDTGRPEAVVGREGYHSLDSLFGSDIAKRLMKGETVPKGWIGGGGFRNFYDSTINKFAESWARRFPGAEVGERRVPGTKRGSPVNEVLAEQFRDAVGDSEPNLLYMLGDDLATKRALSLAQQAPSDYRSLSRSVREGFENQVYRAHKDADMAIDMDEAREIAEEAFKAAQKFLASSSEGHRVHSLRLTPEMKAWIKTNGTPIMSVAGAGAAVGANSETLQRIEELLGGRQ